MTADYLLIYWYLVFCMFFGGKCENASFYPWQWDQQTNSIFFHLRSFLRDSCDICQNLKPDTTQAHPVQLD